jgi:2,3-bisphosphoglycerate-independent phosphoglycerate mutase
MPKRPYVLIVLDGWGMREEKKWNAVACAKTPNFDRYWAECPHTLVRTDGRAVGLPEGQFGNSEVGHQNLGAGRVVVQTSTRISDAIADGSFFANRGTLARHDARSDQPTPSDGACERRRRAQFARASLCFD